MSEQQWVRRDNVTWTIKFGSLTVVVEQFRGPHGFTPWWIKLTGADGLHDAGGMNHTHQLSEEDGWPASASAAELPALERRVLHASLRWARPFIEKFAEAQVDAVIGMAELLRTYEETT